VKLISFALWGEVPRYVVGAVRNAELAPRVYPGWTCRFYCAACVPAETVAKLRSLPQVEVVRRPRRGDWRSLLWRFEPAGEAGVEVVLSRDTDSRLGERERLAVDDWLARGAPFHTMRDHPMHDVAILGGMWGARRGALPEMPALIEGFRAENRWQTDQEFLAAEVAPRVRQSWVEHDPYFARIPFPIRRRGREFVGQPFDENDRPTILGPTDLEAGLRRSARQVLRWAGLRRRP
jgi:hypothetical protein